MDRFPFCQSKPDLDQYLQSLVLARNVPAEAPTIRFHIALVTRPTAITRKPQRTCRQRMEASLGWDNKNLASTTSAKPLRFIIEVF